MLLLGMIADIITPDTVATVNISDFVTGSIRYEPMIVRTYSIKS